MGKMGMCEIGTRAGPYFPEELDANNYVSRLISSNDLLYNLCSCMGVSVFRKKSLIKISMCGVENDIFLYMMHKKLTIVLISNEYYS